MVSIKKLMVISSVLIFSLVSPVLAQSPTPTIPSPEPAHTQSDFAKDVEEGELSIKNDINAQKDQKEIDGNEIDEGEQEDQDIDIDEDIDQDEAQEDINDAKDEVKEEEIKGNEDQKEVNVQDESNKDQKEGTVSPNEK